jgi:predicted permease
MFFDLRFTFRQLAKSPGFSFVVILTMALGIGVNTTTFSWIRPLLFDPLPGAAAQSRLVAVENFATTGAGSTGPLATSYLDYVDYRDHLKLLDILAESRGAFAVGDADRNDRVWCELVSGNYFDVLGVTPEAGRFFSADEKQDTQNAHPVAVISHSFWLQHYGAKTTAIGSALQIDRVQFKIIGVAPEEFHGAGTGLDFQIWAPLTMYGQVTHTGTWMLRDRGTRNFTMLGRLKPGATVGQAGGEAAALANFMARANGEADRGVGLAVLPLAQSHFGPQAFLLRPVEILTAASGLLFLIVCANIANLLLARTTGRQSELCLRLALGASPWRVARQLLTESFLLALAGSLVGLLVAGWLKEALGWLLPSISTPLIVQHRLVGPVLGFSALAAVLAAILAGAAPAYHAARSNGNEVLKGASRGDGTQPGSHRLRGLLVSFEVALAVIAMVGAGMFLDSFRSLRAMAAGFSADGQVLAQFNLATAGYTQAQADAFYQRMTERLNRCAGVTAVSYADTVPLGFYPGNWEPIEVEGYQAGPDESLKIFRNLVGPGYFGLMKIPLVAGRDFNLADGPQSQRVMIVSEAFVRRFLPHGEPLGRKVHGWGKWFTIVGVAKDIKVHQVSEAFAPFFYIPIRQEYRPEYGVTIHVRTTGPLEDAIAAVRREAAAFDPALTMFDAQPMTEYIAGSMYGQKVAACVLMVLGALALLLAGLGIYSVMAYSVTQRTGEIGIRMALGAQPADVTALVLHQGMGFAATGLGVGLAVALALARLAATVLATLQPAGPAVYLAAALFTLLIAFIAVIVPSRRALRIDPIVALRNQ